MFFLFRKIFILLSYKSNNPLSRCLFLIVSLVFISPYLVLYIPSWIIFLFLILFVTGILIIILYFTSIRSYFYLYVPFYFFLLFFLVLFLPYNLFFFLNNYFYLLFLSEFLSLVFLLFFFLLALVIFSRYLLRYRSAMRKM